MRTRRVLSVLVLLGLVLGLSGAGAADANVDITSLEAPGFAEPGDTVRVTATVENTAGEDVHQMEVKAEGFDQVKERNLWGMDDGESDTLTFYLNAPEDQPGTHDITVTVQSRDEEGRVIGGETRTVSIDVEESGTVVEPEESDLRLASITAPASVMAGDTATMDVEVENRGSGDMGGLHVAVDAFGRTVTKEVGTLAGDSTRTVSIDVPVPAAAQGQETAKVSISTFSEQDSASTTLSISSVRATLQIRQDTVTVGEPVTVSGILSRRNTRADLFYAGRFEAPVFSDESGHYTHTIIPERPGVHTVMLTVGDVTVERLLTVRPEIDVHAVAAPDRVGTGSIFDVCSRISRSTTGETELALLVDGTVRKTATVAAGTDTEHCFSTSITATGNHTVRVEASDRGVTASGQTQVTVVETGLSASVFPGQLTLTAGQAGVFQIDIGNDRLRSRQFNVTVTGFEGLSVQSPGTVDLDRGASRTVVVRVVPDETGAHSGTIRVSTEGTVLTESGVDVRAVENPALKNPVIGGAVRAAGDTTQAFQALPRRHKWGLLGGIAAVFLLTSWYWRRRQNEVIEPQY